MKIPVLCSLSGRINKKIDSSACHNRKGGDSRFLKDDRGEEIVGSSSTASGELASASEGYNSLEELHQSKNSGSSESVDGPILVDSSRTAEASGPGCDSCNEHVEGQSTRVQVTMPVS